MILQGPFLCPFARGLNVTFGRMETEFRVGGVTFAGGCVCTIERKIYIYIYLHTYTPHLSCQTLFSDRLSSQLAGQLRQWPRNNTQQFSKLLSLTPTLRRRGEGDAVFHFQKLVYLHIRKNSIYIYICTYIYINTYARWCISKWETPRLKVFPFVVSVESTKQT